MTPAIDSTTSDDGATSMGVSLDGNQAAGSNRALALPDLAFSYYHVAGATMRPRASSSTYSYPGLGCTYLATGSDLFNTELLLPDGAVIKYLRVYYRDTNAAGSVTAWVTRYDHQPDLGFADIISAASPIAFAGGYGFVDSPEVTETVNNETRGYALVSRAADVTTQICGLRVAYYAPAAAPGAPTLNAPVVAGNSVVLSWTPSSGSAPTSYVLTATTTGEALIATVPLTGTSAVFSSVPSGTYLLRLVAVNGVGSSPPSSTVTLVVP
ncbi:MAG TPA: fibronectin type III domain-containing protein [Vicinamibacterales bacterium]|nr:fibronectin type III domain-containing protein [Vicinamibacterales bacterium]